MDVDFAFELVTGMMWNGRPIVADSAIEVEESFKIYQKINRDMHGSCI